MPSPHSQSSHSSVPIPSAAPAATSAVGVSMPDFWSMQQYNNEWSAAQAQADRDWQERMSSTAHQRELADLQAAGLNPVLAAGGSGASTPSGAMAATDNSASSAMASVLNAVIGAQSAQAVANKYTAMEKYIAELNDATKKNYPSSVWGFASSLVNGASHGRGLVGVGKDIAESGLDLLKDLWSMTWLGKYRNSHNGNFDVGDFLRWRLNQATGAGHRSGRF